MPRRRSDLAIAVVLLLALASGCLVGHWLRHFELCCDEPVPTTSLEYAVSAYAELVAALLLLGLGGLVVAVLGRTRWLWLPVAAGAAALLLLAGAHQSRAAALGPTDGVTPDPGAAVLFVLLAPTTWPLLAAALLAVVARVRGRSVPTPR
jgi:hypothetical protein